MLNVFENRKSKSSNRQGAALIELAICLPVFFLITMATIETCRMIYLRQSLKIAAYECARLAIVPGTNRQNVVDQCDLILLPRNINNYQFSCVPADPATLTYGDLFKVSIQIAAKDSSIVGTWFYRNKIFIESVTIMAEY
jgi:Flp pilus assembly protein TadG